MIVIDTSAIIAILAHEPERLDFYKVIANTDRCLISAVNYQEAGTVICARSGVNGLYDLEEFLSLIRAEIIPHDLELAALAIETFRRFGKGMGSSARLNFCDCAAYALAKAMNAPLLFKGNDFAATDIQSAI